MTHPSRRAVVPYTLASVAWVCAAAGWRFGYLLTVEQATATALPLMVAAAIRALQAAICWKGLA